MQERGTESRRERLICSSLGGTWWLSPEYDTCFLLQTQVARLRDLCELGSYGGVCALALLRGARWCVEGRLNYLRGRSDTTPFYACLCFVSSVSFVGGVRVTGHFFTVLFSPLISFLPCLSSWCFAFSCSSSERDTPLRALTPSLLSSSRRRCDVTICVAALFAFPSVIRPPPPIPYRSR